MRLLGRLTSERTADSPSNIAESMNRPTILASPMTVVVTADVILIMALCMTLYASAFAEVTSIIAAPAR